MKRAIIIFSRIPVPGQTKTRLMSSYSGETCAKIHQSFITRIMRVAGEVQADVLVSYTPSCEDVKLKEVFGRHVTEFFLQSGEDLGMRMNQAFFHAFQKGYEQVLLVGTDVPQITKEILEDSFEKLETGADIVLNPTEDGGYYLTGMKAPHEAIWKVEHYGSNTVFEDTVECIRSANLTVAIGARLMDIDTTREYRKWKGLNTEDCIRCNACTEHCLFLSKYRLNLKEFAKRPDLAYSCFFCGKCKEVCPAKIDGAAIAYEMRRKQVIRNGEKLSDASYKGLMWEKNPYKFANYKKGNKKTVLFPGCSFPSFYPKTMKALEELMKKHNIGVIYDCCGKPVFEAGLEKDAEKTIEQLETKLRNQGVEELVTLCPNCYYFLRDRIRIPVADIYEKLDELGEGQKIERDAFAIYLPCPDRTEKVFYRNMSRFLEGQILESYQDIQCCGLGGLAGIKEPDLVKKMVGCAVEKKSPLYTYCASCISNFKRNNVEEAYHVLPAILGIEEQQPGGIKPFLNRAMKKL